jgi:hypothetical protein
MPEKVAGASGGSDGEVHEVHVVHGQVHVYGDSEPVHKKPLTG